MRPTASDGAAWCGPAPTAAEWWTQWNVHPGQAVLLVLFLGAGIAAARAHRRDFVLGWAVLVLAFVSPLCALSVALFSARVAHHLLLVLVAAPLLAVAFPARHGGFLAVAGAAFVVVMWGWHWPAAYAAAYGSSPTYWAMQGSLLVTAILFWRAVMAPRGHALRALMGLVAVSGAMGLLGALLTLAPAPIYGPHASTTASFGLTPIEDQQLGGLLMWVPGMLPFAVAGAILARSRFRHLSGKEAA